VEEGSPDVQAPPACAMPAQYAEDGDAAGGRNEHTATSDQPRRRRGAPPRPAGSDGDSAISGEHSDGREPFGQAGDTGATSQDRTVGGLAMRQALPLFVIQRACDGMGMLQRIGWVPKGLKDLSTGLWGLSLLYNGQQMWLLSIRQCTCMFL
jgi:hypothetical protein